MKIEVHHDYRLQADDPVVQLILARLTASMAKGDAVMADTQKMAGMLMDIAKQMSGIMDSIEALAAELDAPPVTGITAAPISAETIRAQIAARDAAEAAAAAPVIDTPPPPVAESVAAVEPPAPGPDPVSVPAPDVPEPAPAPSGLTTDG